MSLVTGVLGGLESGREGGGGEVTLCDAHWSYSWCALQWECLYRAPFLPDSSSLRVGGSTKWVGYDVTVYSIAL